MRCGAKTPISACFEFFPHLPPYPTRFGLPTASPCKTGQKSQKMTILATGPQGRSRLTASTFRQKSAGLPYGDESWSIFIENRPALPWKVFRTRPPLGQRLTAAKMERGAGLRNAPDQNRAERRDFGRHSCRRLSGSDPRPELCSGRQSPHCF